jgi:hypothetical protein
MSEYCKELGLFYELTRFCVLENREEKFRKYVKRIGSQADKKMVIKFAESVF